MLKFIPLICILVLISCSSSLQTFSDRDPTIDLKKYKTYAWIAPGDTALNAVRKDKLYGNLIVHSADVELAKKGMTVDVSTPDALFMFESRVEEKIQYTQSSTVSVGFGFGGPGYYVGGAAPVAGGTIRSSTYEEGLLYFNMYDTQTGKMIWSGGAKKPLTASTNVEGTIKTAVKFIFVKLPIKHKTKK